MSKLLVVLGPTASGKTSLAVELAKKYSGEIISADSRQVYRGLDIGSGKDLHEYGVVPYHLIDIVDPGYEFNLFEFQKAFCCTFEEVKDRQRLPMLVGGTGMYLDAVLSRYRLVEAPVNADLRERLASKSITDLVSILKSMNPNLHNTTDTLDRERLLRAIEIASAEKNASTSISIPEFVPFVLGIRWDRPKLRSRIRARLMQRLEEGMIEEVERLHENGVSWETLHFYGLEYRYVARYLQGELNRNDMVQKLNSSICTFAKQQEKWFRRMEAKGIEIHWLSGEEDLPAQAYGLLEPLLRG